MIISDIKEFIFIHNPKAGGTSIRDVLHKYATVSVWQHKVNANLPVGNNRKLSKHANARRIRNHVGEVCWNKYFTFAFVRNPWDRIASNYFYAKKYVGAAKHKLAKRLTFTEFVEWYETTCTPKHPEPLQILPQMYYLGQNGKVLVSFIGKFERIHKDFRKICDRIGIKANLPHVNKTKHPFYREIYNKKTKEIIQRLYKQDIEIFGYTF